MPLQPPMPAQLPLRIFIGYDRRMPVLFHTLAHSILSRASLPVSICPLAIHTLSGLLKRDINDIQSTEFSFSRFLVPYLSHYEGWSLFLDNDMIVLDDIAKLWAEKDESCAVQVVKHQHHPKETTKFLGEAQMPYDKKNWSSVMLFNNAKCRALSPDYVNTASGLQLHQFQWLDSETLIGELPAHWNHLVDYDPERPVTDIANLHYTSGGPYFEASRHCQYADIWLQENASMQALSIKKLK